MRPFRRSWVLTSGVVLLVASALSGSSQALNISDAGEYEEGTVQPASIAESRSATGDLLQPFSTDKPSETLFKRYNTLSTLAPVMNVADDVLTKPIPTNKWWANLIHSTVGDDTVAVPAFSNPYALKLPREKAPYGLQACYSYSYRTTSMKDDGTMEFYLHDFHNDLTLSASEFTARPDYEIYGWSDVGATLKTCVSGTTNCMDSALVNGMAFVSATYSGLTPTIQSEYTMTIADSTTAGKYVLKLSNSQTWVVYASDSSITFAIDSTGMALVASGAYSGTVRLAILDDSADQTAYDEYSTCIVRGGTLSVESRTGYSINWETNGTTCESTGLLHFALQHHLDSFASGSSGASKSDVISLNSTTRGAMSGIVTTSSKWTFTEPEMETEIGFYPPTDISADLVTQTNLLSTLKADIAASWSMAAESWYYNGKYYQKYASLCLMAADKAIVGDDTTLLSTCLTKLEALIEPFLANTLEPPLAYETVYSGIVSSMTFTNNDVNVDFGNGVYNDHHYHFGYWVTASAMLKKLDPNWSRMSELETMVWTLLRDVANPSSDDPYFTTFRHFSWFLGHSYSHGVTPMADGKDEESTSEDINFYYGMMLWGQVTGKQEVEDLGSLMLRLNARAIQTYFLMTSDNAVHPAAFVKNHVTGIFFDNKAHYTTWFSAEKYCIHGIQMIPVSPINSFVRTQTFIQEEWDDVLSKESIVTSADLTNAWLSLLLVNEAAIDQADALSKLATVTLDDGLTRSWALYNAATRTATTATSSSVGGDADTAVTAAPIVTTAPTSTSSDTTTATSAPEATTQTPTAATESPTAAADTPTVTTAPSTTSAPATTTSAPTASDSSSGDLLQPFSTDKPSETLFKRYNTLSTLAPVMNVADDVLTKPIPTNKWWANLIHSTVGDNTVAVPAFSNPYALKLPREKAPYGLQACYSYSYRTTSMKDDGTMEFYLHDFHNDLTLSASEFTARPDYEIYGWSDVGATLKTCVSGTTNCMDSALVNGMAFVSATYSGLTPTIQSEYTMTIADSTTAGKYVLKLSNSQTWVVYASDSSITFAIDSTGMALVASGAYSGTVRLAILDDSADQTAYDEYSTCIVRGGTLSVESRTGYSINWETNGTTCESTGLLHFALQHHLDSFASGSSGASKSDVISLNSTTRGAMSGIVTTSSKWTFTEPEMETEIGFYPPTDISADLVTQTNLLSTLKADIAASWSMAAESWYYNGKYYQKYASLCLMAADKAIVGDDTTLLSTCLTKLEALIEPFLANTLEPPLAYETVYSGIVSSMTFTNNDVNVDFGNGVYNDHHYHFGYWVTASAMLKKLDPNWSRMSELETMVWTLLRDVANPSSDDPYFTTFRHFSWFLGHSYSHGVTPMADGKDEESTSEDINFYYGMMLWGQVTGKQEVEDLGSLMLRLNARAIQTYFLMTSDNAVHPAAFVKNHVTGIFFDNKAHYTTWFSAEKYCIHGIQMIPVSPINSFVRTQTFIQEEWDDVLSKESIVTSADLTNAWLSLLLVNEAAIDQADALSKLATVTLDDGLTRSWALYNAATRTATASA